MENSGADAVNDALPEVLYHYTSAAGMQGILGPISSAPWPAPEFPDKNTGGRFGHDNDLYGFVNSAIFQATDVRFMNDDQEIKFGAKVMADEFQKEAANLPSGSELGALLAQLAENFEDGHVFRWPVRCFAVCFCEDPDLLSQWRGYSGGVGGFSIGFAREALEYFPRGVHREGGTSLDDAYPRAELVKVLYGEDESRVRAKDAVKEIKNLYQNRLILPSPMGRGLLPDQAVAVAFRAMAAMKDDAFREEREWRLILPVNFGADGTEVGHFRTRSRAGGLVPFADLVVNARCSHSGSSVGDRSPVKKVVVGPGGGDAQAVAVRDLLRSRGVHGFRGVEVELSRAPFRG